MSEEINIVWGQDLEHCDDHCYEDIGTPKWRCLNRDHVEYQQCSEDFLHCRIDFVVIENPDGTNNYCPNHQSEKEESK